MFVDNYLKIKIHKGICILDHSAEKHVLYSLIENFDASSSNDESRGIKSIHNHVGKECTISEPKPTSKQQDIS